MLTKYDEFMCHQIPSTMDHPYTSAREWTERTWFSAHDISGKMHMVSSIGLYPNRNIIDTYGAVAIDGKMEYLVRASRELRPARDETKIGPFTYEIVEPMKKVRKSLAENEHGLSYDILFDASFPALEEQPQFSRHRGRVQENIVRYVQMGRPSGWIKVDGKTYEIDSNTWRAERDHSWGIRRGGGVPETGVQPGEIPEGYLFNFLVVQFDSWCASYHIRELWDGTRLMFSGGIAYPLGSPVKEIPLTDVDHFFKFRPDMRFPTGADVVLKGPDGLKKELSLKPLGCCYLRPGGYFGYNEFTHGLWMGQSWMDGLRLDISDPAVVRDISFLDDVMCEVRCGDEVGYGITEIVVTGKYPRYGYEGY